MRPASVLLNCCAFAGAVSARNAYLYTFDSSPRTAPAQSSIISPDTAFTIITRRRGVPEDRYLSGVEEGTLEQIISYSGHQQPLFEEADDDAPRLKLFISISGDRIAPLDGDYPRLTIPDARFQFFTEIQPRKEELCLHESGTTADYSLTTDGEVLDGYKSVSTESCKLLTDFMSNQNSWPSGILAKVLKELSLSVSKFFPKDSSSYSRAEQYNPTTATSELIDILSEFSTSHSVQSTLLLLERDGLNNQGDVLGQFVRRDESPLDLPTSDLSSASPASHVLASNFTLPSKLPACFSSRSACENATNSCLGHGSCIKNHGLSSCYKCSCNSTIVRENADGSTKSVQWAGAACQKKDVSAPFFLFASFGVAMMALVAGSIGMLYSMGSEELPSVIGAGVAGPRAQK